MTSRRKKTRSRPDDSDAEEVHDDALEAQDKGKRVHGKKTSEKKKVEEEEEEEEEEDVVVEDESDAARASGGGGEGEGASGTGKFARPRGAAPTGKVWDYSRGTWIPRPNYDLIETVTDLLKTIHADTKQKRPRGAAPTGMVWNYASGTWIDEREYAQELLKGGDDFVNALREKAKRAKAERASSEARADGDPNKPKRGRGRPRLVDGKGSSSTLQKKSKKRDPKQSQNKRPRSHATKGTSNPARKPSSKVRRVCTGKRNSKTANFFPVAGINNGTDHLSGITLRHLTPSGSTLVDELREVEDRILLEERLFLEGDQRVSSGNVVLGWPGLGARFDSWARVYGLTPSGQGSTKPANVDAEQVASAFSAQNVTNTHLKEAFERGKSGKSGASSSSSTKA